MDSTIQQIKKAMAATEELKEKGQINEGVYLTMCDAYKQYYDASQKKKRRRSETTETAGEEQRQEQDQRQEQEGNEEPRERVEQEEEVIRDDEEDDEENDEEDIFRVQIGGVLEERELQRQRGLVVLQSETGLHGLHIRRAHAAYVRELPDTVPGEDRILKVHEEGRRLNFLKPEFFRCEKLKHELISVCRGAAMLAEEAKFHADQFCMMVATGNRLQLHQRHLFTEKQKDAKNATIQAMQFLLHAMRVSVQTQLQKTLSKLQRMPLGSEVLAIFSDNNRRGVSRVDLKIRTVLTAENLDESATRELIDYFKQTYTHISVALAEEAVEAAKEVATVIQYAKASGWFLGGGIVDGALSAYADMNQKVQIEIATAEAALARLQDNEGGAGAFSTSEATQIVLRAQNAATRARGLIGDTYVLRWQGWH